MPWRPIHRYLLEISNLVLQDGRSITLTDERFAATEGLFNPSVCDMYNVGPLASSLALPDVVGESLYRIDGEVPLPVRYTLCICDVSCREGWVGHLSRT